MKKTGSSIEQDLYTLINSSALKTAIGGTIYKQGVRPMNAKTEDAVVAFVTGLDGQVQTGAVNLSIYTADIDAGGGILVRNSKRLRELEATAQEVVQAIDQASAEYDVTLGGMIQTYQAEGTNQHYAHAKIRFKRITH